MLFLAVPLYPAVTRMKGEIVCFYYKRAGHKISDYTALKKKERFAKTVGLISTSCENHSPVQVVQKQNEQSDISEVEIENTKSHNDYAPFLTEGTVSFFLVPRRMFLFVSFAILELHNPSCWKDFCLCLTVLLLEPAYWLEGLRWDLWKFLYTVYISRRNLCQVMLSLEFVQCYLFVVLLLFLATI